jgi:hypothetical protein
MGKNMPRERTPNQISSRQRSMGPEGHKIIEERSLHQRPEIVAHPYVRLQALRGASLETKRVLAVDSHTVLDIRTKGQAPIAFLFLDAHLHRQKWSVVNFSTGVTRT